MKGLKGRAVLSAQRDYIYLPLGQIPENNSMKNSCVNRNILCW